MKLAWCTDIHLNFLGEAKVRAFCQELAAWKPDAILLGGDLAEAADVCDQLTLVADELARPIYFVLGNHDYYGGSIAEVRERVRRLHDEYEHLNWLPASGVVELTPDTALIGHSGWGDARLGDFMSSTVLLNDYIRIRELCAASSREELRDALTALGDEAAAYVREVLADALARFRHVLFLTHVPPFHAACWHENNLSDDNWLPHFSCGAVGEVLTDLMAAHPERALSVLCGHTHSAGECWPLPNLHVRTGAAVYGKPAAQAPLVVH